ncbi:transposable element Tc1 transposase [Trichonephila clavipes]|nr:transposable element Tc1 transposase [Trichonephila clavipes]
MLAMIRYLDHWPTAALVTSVETQSLRWYGVEVSSSSLDRGSKLRGRPVKSVHLIVIPSIHGGLRYMISSVVILEVTMIQPVKLSQQNLLPLLYGPILKCLVPAQRNSVVGFCDQRLMGGNTAMETKQKGFLVYGCYRNNSPGYLRTATSVLMSASSIRRRLLHRELRVRLPLYMIPITANYRLLRLQWAHEHRAWQTDWHQVVFSVKSCFNLWDYDGHSRVRRYAGERCLPECVIKRVLGHYVVIERHSGLTSGVMIWGAILYHGRSNLLRIERNLNSNRYVREMLQPEVISFL